MRMRSDFIAVRAGIFEKLFITKAELAADNTYIKPHNYYREEFKQDELRALKIIDYKQDAHGSSRGCDRESRNGPRKGFYRHGRRQSRGHKNSPLVKF